MTILAALLVGSFFVPQDSWAPTSTLGAPSPRMNHTAVWTGREMIVWGGEDGSGALVNGAKYDPFTNTWSPVTPVRAPSARLGHVAVWTGKEMIIYGGSGATLSGARYDPVLDAWTPTSGTGSPAAAVPFRAVWTGLEMIVWSQQNQTGGRYDPVADTWTAVSSSGPSGGAGEIQLWTGSTLIAWGNSPDPGGLYNPLTDAWTSMSTVGASVSGSPAGVWTGRDLLTFGYDFDRYDPVTNTWTPNSGAPTDFVFPQAVWTGREAVVIGLSPAAANVPARARYDPRADSWKTITDVNAPSPRVFFTIVWTGSFAIAWGGTASGAPPESLDTGAIYYPPPFFNLTETDANSGCFASATRGAAASGWRIVAVLVGAVLLMALVPRRWASRALPCLFLVLLSSVASAQEETPKSQPDPPTPLQEPEAANAGEALDWSFRSGAGIWLNGLEFEAVSPDGPLKLNSGGMGLFNVSVGHLLVEPLFGRVTTEVAFGDDAVAITAALDVGLPLFRGNPGPARIDGEIFLGGMISRLEIDRSEFEDFKPGLGFHAGVTGRVSLSPGWSLDATVEYRRISYEWSGDRLEGDKDAAGSGAAATVGFTIRF